MQYSTTIQQTLIKVRSFGEALLKAKPPKYFFEGMVHGNEFNAEEVVRRAFLYQMIVLPMGQPWLLGLSVASAGDPTWHDHRSC
jgi:hypothetical protein